MKLDCHCGGWTARERREQDPATRPIVWRCAMPGCGRRICSACEGTVAEVPALDRVCDDCWAGVLALLEVLLFTVATRRAS